MSAISILSGRPDVLWHLLSLKQLHGGLLALRMHKNEEWHDMLVDDRFPVTANGHLAFAKSDDTSEFWPSAIERALAKMYGSYAALTNGMTVSQGLADLTGAPVEVTKMPTTTEGRDALWTKMNLSIEDGAIVGCMRSEICPAFSEEAVHASQQKWKPAGDGSVRPGSRDRHAGSEFVMPVEVRESTTFAGSASSE
jgi:hypothetical protein